MVRFLGAFGISSLWANVFYIAIPNDEVYGINFKYLYYLIPLVAALGKKCYEKLSKILIQSYSNLFSKFAKLLIIFFSILEYNFSFQKCSNLCVFIGTWIVGNIGREKGSIWAALIGAYICYPSLYYFGDENMWIICMSLASTLAFDSFSKKWRLTPRKKQSATRRILIVSLVVLLYGSCWASYLYFNATVVDSDGEEIKLTDAVKHFFTSPIWMDVKVCFKFNFVLCSNICIVLNF